MSEGLEAIGKYRIPLPDCDEQHDDDEACRNNESARPYEADEPHDIWGSGAVSW